MSETITIHATITAPITKVWDCWTNPVHITQWAFASDDWEAPKASNDVRVGRTFSTIMSAKDKSAGFDFAGTYTAVIPNELIEYDMDGDNRHVKIVFEQTTGGVHITQTFDAETENPIEMQRNGWQSILNNFKRYCER